MLPMNKQPRIKSEKIPEPTSGPMNTPLEPLVPITCPFQKPQVKNSEDPHRHMKSDLL